MLALSQKLQQCKHGYLTGREAAKVAKRKSFDPSVQIRVLKTLNISYSHSSTLVCCCAIPVDSSWLVDFDCHTAESCRVSSRRRLKQTLGQIRKLFAARGRAVSFLSRGQTERVSRLRTVLNGCQNGQLAPLTPGLRNES